MRFVLFLQNLEAAMAESARLISEVQKQADLVAAEAEARAKVRGVAIEVLPAPSVFPAPVNVNTAGRS
jgi:hypothetical protein